MNFLALLPLALDLTGTKDLSFPFSVRGTKYTASFAPSMYSGPLTISIGTALMLAGIVLDKGLGVYPDIRIGALQGTLTISRATFN